MKPSGYVDKILVGDSVKVMRTLPAESMSTCITSPPYWNLRDYGIKGQLGLEESPEKFVEVMVGVFREVRRILRPDGTLWLNLGDSYAGSGKGRNADGTHSEGGKQGTSRGTIEGKLGKTPARPRALRGRRKTAPGKTASAGIPAKNLVGIPWRVALALQGDGWILRSDVIWAKPCPMPESVYDRPTRSHEYIFLLTKGNKPIFWTHPERATVWTCPDPEYEWTRKGSLAKTRTQPSEKWWGKWTRRNLWAGHDYFYDSDAIRDPLAEKTFTTYGVRAKARQEDPTGLIKSNRWANTAGDRAPRLLEDGTRAGANKKTVWTVASPGYSGAHFATFPPDLIRPCVRAGCRPDGVVFDPFMGAGTTALVAAQENRHFCGVELGKKYAEDACRRIQNEVDQKKFC